MAARARILSLVPLVRFFRAGALVFDFAAVANVVSSFYPGEFAERIKLLLNIFSGRGAAALLMHREATMSRI
jgi:hypothetical protein